MADGKDGGKTYWLDKAGSVDKIWYALLILCFVLTAADLFYEKHPHFEIEKWFGFYSGFGFVFSVGLVLGAKELRRILMRKEDYYDDD